jgi:hypothetical protein
MPFAPQNCCACFTSVSEKLKNESVNFANPYVWLIVGLVVIGVIYWLASHYFSPEAKAERRRRRSNAPLRSTAKRPMVKLSVKTKNDRR